MRRPIDSENLYKFLTDQRVKERGAYSKGVNTGLDIARSALRNEQIAPTFTPPNEPLTLEQLREMNGEPVWIVEHPDWGHWELSADAEDYIADRDQDLYGLKHDDPAGQCGLHVLGWLAYRRPPERQGGDADHA